MRRFYFQIAESGEEIGYDHNGNIRGARTYAKKLANELHETIIINDCITDEIEDYIYPDENKEESQ